MVDTEQHVIVSLGGSLIAPDDIDVSFVKKFCSLVESYVKKGYRFIIITGGGQITRKYQEALAASGTDTEDALDWIGVYATHLHAHFIRLNLGDLASSSIIIDPTVPIETDKPVTVGGGWKPGWSTDYDAVLIAKNINAKHIVNLSNIEYVYDADPNEDASAKPIKEISWAEFRDLLPDDWTPGANTPFDPIAAKEAQNLGLTVVTLYGGDLDRFTAYLDHGVVTGTKITPKV